MPNTIADLKKLLEEYGDEEEIVLRIRPAMDDMEVGTFTAERVQFVAITYHSYMPGRSPAANTNRPNRPSAPSSQRGSLTPPK